MAQPKRLAEANAGGRSAADAQFSVALAYHDGTVDGVQQDGKLAAKFYRLAIGNGHITSYFNLSILYSTGGPNLLRDLAECHALLLQGAQAGSAYCQLSLATDFEKGQYGAGAPDLTAAALWLDRALANPETATLTYNDGTTGADKARAGKARLARAKKLAAGEKDLTPLQLAEADAGNAAAQFQVGHDYHFANDGVTQDYKLAAKYYRLAIGNGHIKSYLSLSILYSTGGPNLAQDLAECHALRLQGAKAGSAYCQLQLAQDCEKAQDGAGAKDPTAAVYWLTVTLANPATASLVYRDGTTGVDDAREARQRLLPAAAKAAAIQLTRIDDTAATRKLAEAESTLFQRFLDGTTNANDRNDAFFKDIYQALAAAEVKRMLAIGLAATFHYESQADWHRVANIPTVTHSDTVTLSAKLAAAAARMTRKTSSSSLHHNDEEDEFGFGAEAELTDGLRAYANVLLQTARYTRRGTTKLFEELAATFNAAGCVPIYAAVCRQVHHVCAVPSTVWHPLPVCSLFTTAFCFICCVWCAAPRVPGSKRTRTWCRVGPVKDMSRVEDKMREYLEQGADDNAQYEAARRVIDLIRATYEFKNPREYVPPASCRVPVGVACVKQSLLDGVQRPP